MAELPQVPGTGLSREDFEKGKIIFTRGSPNAKYAWDAGVGIGRYLDGLKQGEIRGSHCPRCERTVVPPRAFCEICFSPGVEWRTLQDTGIVNTFSICYFTWDMRRVKRPFIPSVIEIDGASPGMGILHMIGDADPEKVAIGMPVQAVWRSEHEREGAITDIIHFRPKEA